MRRDWPDLLGGGVLALTGAAVAAHAGLRLEIGSLRQMGPGFLPVALGLLLAAFGAIIAVPAWGRAGETLRIAWTEMLCVIGGILVFGLGVQRLGLILATAALALIASIPAPRPGLAWRLVLAGCITLLTWLVFAAGLRIGLPLWPRLP